MWTAYFLSAFAIEYLGGSFGLGIMAHAYTRLQIGDTPGTIFKVSFLLLTDEGFTK
jgi:hypothetical protein